MVDPTRSAYAGASAGRSGTRGRRAGEAGRLGKRRPREAHAPVWGRSTAATHGPGSGSDAPDGASGRARIVESIIGPGGTGAAEEPPRDAAAAPYRPRSPPG